VAFGHAGCDRDVELRQLQPYRPVVLSDVLRVAENPWKGALQLRPYYKKQVSERVIDEYGCSRCSYGEKWQKHSLIMVWGEGGRYSWIPEPMCGTNQFCDACCLCEETGRYRHLESIGGREAQSIYKKHRLPLPLFRSLLDQNEIVQGDGEKIWGLNLFCGTDSLKDVFKERDYGYVGVDWEGEQFVCSDGGRVVARFLVDLSSCTLKDLLHKIYHATGLEGRDLVVIWASPPCTTFSKLDRTNKSKHRNWKKNGAPRSPLAFFDDILVAHLFAELRGGG
jgi:hypothetical protein